MSPRAAFGIALSFVLGLAACNTDDTSAPPPDEDLGPPAETATLVDGDTTFTTDVWVTADGARHYRTTGIELGQLVSVTEAVRLAGSALLPLKMHITFGDGAAPIDHELPLQLPVATEDLDRLTAAIAYMHEQTVKAERAAATGVVEQDKPGCDFPTVLQNSCAGGGGCCDVHDKCYQDNGCTSGSWLGTEGAACTGCNLEVTACISGSTYAPYIGFAFFGPWGFVVGMVAGWLFDHVTGESDCCRFKGPSGFGNICQDQSCESPAGWYGWGNHACHVGPDTFVNIYCTSVPYYLPNGAGPYYYFQGCYKWDARVNTLYKLPDDQIWCDSQNENGYCNDRFDCVACPTPPAGIGPECNPPFFSPGSLMDTICQQNQPTGTPNPPVPPWVPSCAESGGNTCDNDLSDGSACGPEYNLLTAYDCVHCCNKDTTGPVCGDGACNGGEDCNGCPGDCGACPPTCEWVDCQGTCNGGVWNDVCGVCGGDGSSCQPPPPPPPPPPTCDWVDCQGTCNGNVWDDVCGVCGGDGTSCQPPPPPPPPACDWYDCQGTCNGGVWNDACGVCGGDGTSCQPPPCSWYDCQGTCNGGVWNDACGVCGGDGSSCQPPPCGWYDCQGTCNGGVWNDACGVCGGDGSSCQPPPCSWFDCQGTCNGGVWNDACGVCGGDGSSCQPPPCGWFDCQGTCNGNVWNDSCGVCGGDGSSCQPPPCQWTDCQGTCNGNVWNDSCGVCGGDGSSCACQWYDCMGICNGPYNYDWCGNCGGDGSECYP